jgi:hypothetical protein
MGQTQQKHKKTNWKEYPQWRIKGAYLDYYHEKSYPVFEYLYVTFSLLSVFRPNGDIFQAHSISQDTQCNGRGIRISIGKQIQKVTGYI